MKFTKKRYCKLVLTFHNVSECKTAIYFSFWFTLQFMWPGDIDHYSLALLHLFDKPRDTLSNKDRARPNETSIITIKGNFWVILK